MNRGYIKLWRKVEDTGLLQDPPLLAIWCWCLLRATYKPRTIAMRTGRGNTLVELIPGEFVTGINSSKELKMKPSTFRDRLKRLERMGMISILPATHYSKVSIVKWDAYQTDEEVGRQPTVNQPSANRQPTATNKKVSSKESKKEPKTFVRPTLEQVETYCQERGNSVDPQAWMDHYTSNGFKIGGRGAMKDWKAAVRTWERNGVNAKPKAKGQTAFDNIYEQMGASNGTSRSGRIGGTDTGVVRQLETHRKGDT